MNAFTSIGGGLYSIGEGERRFVRLMREWASLRGRGQPLLPVFVACAELSSLGSHAAVAIDSMLTLTEACLERTLRAEPAASRALGFDERAVLALLDQGRFVHGAQAPRSIPHGLPGVLAWATVAVRKAFTEAGISLETSPPTSASCPFAL